MPLNYGEGTIAEHKACRTAAVAFDVSHLGTVRVAGAGAPDLLQAHADRRPEQDRARSDPVHPPPGRGRRLGPRRHHRVVGGARTGSTSCRTPPTPSGWSMRSSGDGVSGRRCHRGARHLAVQGPTARQRPGQAVAPRGLRRWPQAGSARERVSAAWPSRWPAPATPVKTGSRSPLPSASPIWSGRPSLGRRCGPGRARAPGTPCASRRACPCTATSWARASPRCRRGWAGSWAGTRATSGGGRPSRPSGTPARPVACGACSWTASARPGPTSPWSTPTGAVLGTVSSGNFSPMLDRGIALAFLTPEIEPGTRVAVDIRGRREPAEVVTPPFVTGAH